MDKELKKYIKNNLKQEKRKNKNVSIKNILLFPFRLIITLISTIKNLLFNRYCGLIAEEIDIEDYIKENNAYNDFQTTLFKMIDERNLIDSNVYNKVHIDRRLFSKIRNDKNYHPSKETIILLGLSMELSENEIEKLLDSASYSLPRNNHYDLIIRYCFVKGIYKLTDVNDLLDQYNCKLFNY